MSTNIKRGSICKVMGSNFEDYVIVVGGGGGSARDDNDENIFITMDAAGCLTMTDAKVLQPVKYDDITCYLDAIRYVLINSEIYQKTFC
jgi:hypothetical protein